MKDIIWTVYRVKHTDGRAVYGQTTTHPTKRAAVQAVMSERAPKSAIVRVGHTYTITQAQ